MSELKAGDLAIVIDSTEPADLGKVVEVLDVFVDDKPEYTYKGEAHEGANDGVPSAFVDLGPDLGGIFIFGLYQLMPLHGQFTPETERETELVK